MSRAEPLPAARDRGLRSAVRAAAIDFYYQSIRLVPANIAWGVGLIAVVIVGMAGGPVVTLVACPFLAIPYVGIVRLATLTVRGHDVVLSDLWRAYRRFGLPALGIGAAVTIAYAVLASNAVVGASAGTFIGWLFATLAVSGMVALWVVGFPLWVLLVDPERSDRAVRDRLRLAVMLAVAAPGRLSALALLLTVILFVSTIAFAALLTISVAYSGLFAARYILPAADRLETWLATRGDEAAPIIRG